MRLKGKDREVNLGLLEAAHKAGKGDTDAIGRHYLAGLDELAGLGIGWARQKLDAFALVGAKAATYKGAAGAVHFNPSYLLDAVRSMTGETVEMRTFDDIKPALFVEDRILGGTRTRLLMPVRVR